MINSKSWPIYLTALMLLQQPSIPEHLRDDESVWSHLWPVLLVGGIFMLIAWGIYVVNKEPKYNNFLGLFFLSRLRELQADTRGLWLYKGLDREKELWKLAEAFEQMHLERKKLVDLVNSEQDRDACREDLLKTLKIAKLCLEEAREDHMPSDGWAVIGRASVELPAKRKSRSQRIALCESLIERANTQLSYIEGWKAPLIETHKIQFAEIKAEIECTRSGGDSGRSKATSGVIRIWDVGDYVITQEMIETGESRVLAKCRITSANVGEEIKVAFDISRESRIALKEQVSGQTESRPL